MSVSIVTIVRSQGLLVCAVADGCHGLLGCEGPGLDLLARTNLHLPQRRLFYPMTVGAGTAYHLREEVLALAPWYPGDPAM